MSDGADATAGAAAAASQKKKRKSKKSGRKQPAADAEKNSTGPSAKHRSDAKQPGKHLNENKKVHHKGKKKPGPTANGGRQNDRPQKSTDNNNATSERSRSRRKQANFEDYASLASVNARYAANDATLIRGKIRVMPGRNGAAFVSCDRGSQCRDVVIKDESARNRSISGDIVFVELDPVADGVVVEGDTEKRSQSEVTLNDFMSKLDVNERLVVNDTKVERDCRDNQDTVVYEEEEYLIEDSPNASANGDEADERWQDDGVQVSLWDPQVNLRRKSTASRMSSTGTVGRREGSQRSGRVIFVIPPKSTCQAPSEFNPEDERHLTQIPKRIIVGTLTRLPGRGGKDGRVLLTPNDKSLPQFMCPLNTKMDACDDPETKALYRGEYSYGDWRANDKWPPVTRVTKLCQTGNVEDETKALLVENGVDHGEFTPGVLRDVERAVKSGRFYDRKKDSGEMGWRPTKSMLRGRRDYRKTRVFTIDPTTAKDLDDALHITPLPDGRVEIGVHIADVSHFVQPDTDVDAEALKRATTVYLVNGIVPMLPKPLCEIACSLNENVERLAFSCVWKMNMDGTMSKKGDEAGDKDDIWYGRTVIKSCARLDYATAQNIIDRKVATGEDRASLDDNFWPRSRQPTGGHTHDQVAHDVRLMHRVAMARRRLRFQNGALALNGIKLAFKLEEDGETPQMCAPYPIRDSNRLIEEYMLLANYLVAQRLITHAHGRALLRNHGPPLDNGMQQVVDVSREALGFAIDTTSSSSLQESLSRLSRECDDDLVVQCVTESLMTPMRPAEYIAAGEIDGTEWAHFALNIPYYTHFTSPIRRYPDVIVHRLLQATLEGEEAVEGFPLDQREVHDAADHCNEMRMSAKKAQERSDRVFLSLYLRKNPIESTLGVCLGVGEKTFTVFVPSLGCSTRVFLQEHQDTLNVNAYTDDHGRRKIVVSPKTTTVPGQEVPDQADAAVRRPGWKSLDVKVFTKLEVACTCKVQPPIDVKVRLVGPWLES